MRSQSPIPCINPSEPPSSRVDNRSERGGLREADASRFIKPFQPCRIGLRGWDYMTNHTSSLFISSHTLRIARHVNNFWKNLMDEDGWWVVNFLSPVKMQLRLHVHHNNKTPEEGKYCSVRIRRIKWKQLKTSSALSHPKTTPLLSIVWSPKRLRSTKQRDKPYTHANLTRTPITKPQSNDNDQIAETKSVCLFLQYISDLKVAKRT